MKTVEEQVPGQPMDRGQMNEIIDEASVAFRDPLTPWSQQKDERLFAALAWMRNDCPSYYKSCIHPLLVERAGNLAHRTESAIELWTSTQHRKGYSASTNNQTNPFVHHWLRALHAFRAAFVACTSAYDEAFKAKDGARIAVTRVAAQSLLMLWEQGNSHCPSLARIVRERLDLLLLQSSEEQESRKLYEEFRWHTVRWAIILAKISQNEASDARWSAELALGRKACPAHSAGLGPTTLAHVYVRYGFTPEIIVDISLAAYRSYDEDRLS